MSLRKQGSNPLLVIPAEPAPAKAGGRDPVFLPSFLLQSVPAKAGIGKTKDMKIFSYWVPVYAGMTEKE